MAVTAGWTAYTAGSNGTLSGVTATDGVTTFSFGGSDDATASGSVTDDPITAPGSGVARSVVRFFKIKLTGDGDGGIVTGSTCLIKRTATPIGASATSLDGEATTVLKGKSQLADSLYLHDSTAELASGTGVTTLSYDGGNNLVLLGADTADLTSTNVQTGLFGLQVEVASTSTAGTDPGLQVTFDVTV